MSVIRVNKTDNYTVMSNHHFKNKNLSLKAKGLLSMMLSLPDDWDYTIAGLVAICKEQETSVISALDELKKEGYVVIKKLMPNETKSGRIEYEYNIYEHPYDEKQDIEKQGVENQGLEFQGVENQGQLNTKELNTKKSNTNNIKNIVDYLNKRAGTSYRETTPKTQKLIRSRMKEGFEEADFLYVIDKKVAQWKNTEMQKYLRPETLFGTKFEGYYNEDIIVNDNYEMRKG